MELPITIIVTLMVTLIVGASVLYFAKDTLFTSGNELRKLGTIASSTEQPIIRVASVSQQQVRDLTRQCAADVKGAADKRLCFIVRAQTFDPTIAALNTQTFTEGERNLTITVSATLSNINALFIYYNPLGTIDIES
jgi:hypothetical protein